MRTLKDIIDMKKTSCMPFETEFEYMVETLYDWYIAKLDGEERIKRFLEDWDDESKEYWLFVLDERIKLGEEEFLI